jgi:hypothetical protein
MQAELTVVLVSDYAAGSDKGWEDLRHTLAALAHQDFTGTTEFLLVEHTSNELPADVHALLPSLRLVRSGHSSSYGLKNDGVREASADLVITLDADCRPERDWLTRIAAAWKEHPEAAAISGRTQYEGKNVWEQILALLTRAYVDTGRVGSTEYVSNNNACWRKSVYLAHPLPVDLGPFAARLQSEAVLRGGGRFVFDPAIRVTHEFEGWSMEGDIRRNSGYGTVITRLRDSKMPYAGLIRMGPAAIPLIVAGKTLNSWRDCLRCWRHYGLKAYQLPMALALGAVLTTMEVPGMWAAFRQQTLTATAYR